MATWSRAAAAPSDGPEERESEPRCCRPLDRRIRGATSSGRTGRGVAEKAFSSGASRWFQQLVHKDSDVDLRAVGHVGHSESNVVDVVGRRLLHTTVVRSPPSASTRPEAAKWSGFKAQSCNRGCCRTPRATSSAELCHLLPKEIGESGRRWRTQAPLRKRVGSTVTTVVNVLAGHTAESGRATPPATLPRQLGRLA